ncbi:hypothetical protein TKK_0001821 [Trichogramma kaykai]|uniref:Gamma-tubulin complex component n=1 Tax=Trichogramma kaykai TaxID=54128 RepID=A0ABD2XH50_9HYME
MGTKILSDIHRDLKLLITAISGFEESHEGFPICERFALSQIKHHRYLSVNSNAVKREIEEITQKFLIHGKYDVAKEFKELVESFLTCFDFERHPQYDLQWSLLSLLLNLANETNKSEISTLLSRDRSLNGHNSSTEEEKLEEIDWAQYLKEGQEEFFNQYYSDSDSDWSEDENDGQLNLSSYKQENEPNEKKSHIIHNFIEISSREQINDLPQQIISKNWLKNNVQTFWWNELDWHQHRVDSPFAAAHFNEVWKKSTLRNRKVTSTISEYQACRELLWMFHAQSTMTLYQEEANSKFSVKEATIPSLTTVAFKSMLRSFCQYYTMIKDIENFLENVLRMKESSENYHKPSFTYETYATMVQHELLKIKTGLSDFEIEVMKQDSQKTFLSISKLLKVQLDKIKTIYEIHKTVTEDWEKSENWQSASKLLSKLFHKIQNCSKPDAINLCVSLYLSCLSVYLNIVDVWLSQGRLEDWRDEFLIARCTETTETSSRGYSRCLEEFVVRTLDSICLEDPVMKILMHKVYHMGRSVELLATLDRMSDLWNMTEKEHVFSGSLREECLKEISLESAKYDKSLIPSDCIDSTSVTLAIRVPNCSRSIDDVEQAITQQVMATNNPFFSKALETFIPPEDDVIDSSSTRLIKNVTTSIDFVNKTRVVPPWRRILELVIGRVLDAKFSGASKLVKDILMKEYKLDAKLKLMRSVYMMESHVMNKFCNLIFNEIESNRMWNNSYYVTCLLGEVLTHEWPESTSHWSITVANIRTVKVLEAVDGIKLHYAAGWPINMLLSEETLDKYNQIFRFELKLKWAMWTLNNLKFNDLNRVDDSIVHDTIQNFHIKRLECLRFWLMHAVGSIHTYLSGQVLQGLGQKLVKDLAQAENFEAIVTIHNEYVENVYEHCLQTEEFSDLTRAIHKLLEMCHEVRAKWKPDSLSFIGKALDDLENDYVKYHAYLALGLHNAVQHKDADYLTGLSSAFSCSMPSTQNSDIHK